MTVEGPWLALLPPDRIHNLLQLFAWDFEAGCISSQNLWGWSEHWRFWVQVGSVLILGLEEFGNL